LFWALLEIRKPLRILIFSGFYFEINFIEL